MKPSAVDRTPSLFTGKTDLEDPNARDGSHPEEPRRPPTRRPLKWHGAHTRWWVEKRVNGRDVEVCSVTLRKDGYLAEFGGKTLGVFKTIGEAGAACEAAR